MAQIKKKNGIHEAVVDGDYVRVLELIDNGVNPDDKDDNGDTPLHVASLLNKELCARVLVAAGANPKSSNSMGIHPAVIAQEAGNERIAIFLNSQKVNIRESEKDILEKLKSINSAVVMFKGVLKSFFPKSSDMPKGLFKKILSGVEDTEKILADFKNW